MIREFVEKTLGRIFATQAREPDPAHMSRAEWRDAAEATEPSGRPMHDERVDDSHAAASEARQAMEASPPMETPLVDDSRTAKAHGRAVNEPDGSHLESDLVDESDVAAADAREVSPHEPPRSEPAADTDTAREDIERANRSTDEGGNAWQRRKSWPV